MKILQNHIVPVLRLEEEGGHIRFRRLWGTAFFINSNGAFVTARHVIEDALAEVEREGGRVVLAMRKADDPLHSYVGDIEGVSFADQPYDVAVGQTAQPSGGCFLPADTNRVWAWHDVYTAGYAESALSRDGERVRPDTRSLKGYVVRKVPRGEFLSKTGAHPDAFEVDFAIPFCMSGSPLVLRYSSDSTPPPGAPFPLLGVCTGTETVNVGTETEHYGVAHDLTPLLGWKPDCWSGKALGEAFQPDAD